jgi:FAD/FMN-containing dehydrogenase
VKAIGSRHSFNRVADTDGVLVSTEALGLPIEIDQATDTVRVGAGTTHAVLARALQARGRALPNLASLPHISVAGAVQTGTHGSGVRNPALSASVAAVEIVRADGSLDVVRRGDDAFGASVVGLGALGVVIALVLDTVPTFDVVQTVHHDLPWDAALEDFGALMAHAYSVSLFTRYTGDVVGQVWAKARVGDAPLATPLDLVALGARPASEAVHMLPDTAADAVTPQLRVPGPWLDRLPHFRAEFTPSAGEEIQSEYLVPAEGTERLDRRRRRLAEPERRPRQHRVPLHLAPRHGRGARGPAERRGGAGPVRRAPPLGQGGHPRPRGAASSLPSPRRLRGPRRRGRPRGPLPQRTPRPPRLRRSTPCLRPPRPTPRLPSPRRHRPFP